MRLRRLVLVVLLVALLSTSVAAGNAVTAAERTVLSGAFVKASLAETDAYGAARTMIVEGVTPPANASEGGESGVESGNSGAEGDGPARVDEGGPPPFLANATAEVVETTLTDAYVRREVETNVDRTYGYLHGEEETLVVSVDVAPIRANLSAAIAGEIRNASVGDLLSSVGSGSSTVTVEGTEFDLAVVGEMAEGPAAYEAARAEFRADLRSTIVEELADRAFEASTDDERLGLVVDGYDPDDHTAAEKRAMVEAREPEIRATLGERIEAERGDEVDAEVEERLAALAAVDGEDLAPAVNASADGLPPALLSPVADLAAAGVRGLTTEEPYGTFVAERDEARDRFATNVSALVGGQLEGETGAEYVLVASSDPGASEGFERARTAVRVVDGLSILLPLVSLALVGGLWWLTRSPAVTAGGAGVGLLAGGLPGYVLARLAGARLVGLLEGSGLPPEATGLLAALAGRVLDVVAGQSLALVVVGGCLVAVAAYLHVFGTPAWAFVSRRTA